MKEIRIHQRIIVFIDEIHTIVGAGGAEGAIDASNILKPALSRREIQCIGATTPGEYRKYIERDSALERRFQAIMVEEPSVDETVEILKGIKIFYERHHKVSYDPKAIIAASQLSQRYITERCLPDKAIDIIDEVGSKKRIVGETLPSELVEVDQEINKLNTEKIILVNSQNFEGAALLRDRVFDLQEERNKLEIDSRRVQEEKGERRISEDDVYDVIADITGIPISRLVESESERLLNMEDELSQSIIGQKKAVKAVASAIRKSRVGLFRKNRPIGSFLFLGPTGVGKTLLAKTLAEYLFGYADSLIRVDMSDYMEKHSVSRLVGAPPGYVGYEEGGVLTEKIRKRPYSVILFDEVEKAHPDMYNLLLQILEEGELQDNLGHRVSFHNTVLIMTSNMGSDRLFQANVGFSKEVDPEQAFSLTDLSQFFRPEFLNRLDEIVTFDVLNPEEIEKIVYLMMADVEKGLVDAGIVLDLSVSAHRYLVEKGYSRQFGARNLRRLISKEIEDRLALAILENKIPLGSKVKVMLQGDEITLSISKKKTLSLVTKT